MPPRDVPAAPPSHDRPDLAALTGLRGAFALWVVLFHLTAGFELQRIAVAERLTQGVTNVLHSGALAVEGFFILSGFILSYAHAHEFTRRSWLGPAWRFWGLRLARIYPVHAAVLICYVALNAAGFDWLIRTCGNPENRPADCDRFSHQTLVEQLLLVSSWGVNPPVGWNFVSWSAASEWFAYLCFPLALIAVSRVGSRWAIVAGLALLAAMIPVLIRFAPQYNGVSDDYGLLRVVPTFLCGCLLFRAYAAPRFEDAPWPAISALCLLAVLALVASAAFPMGAVVFLALLILSLASRQSGAVGSVLSTAPMQWLGRVSYSLYMTHFLVLELLNIAVQRSGRTFAYKTTPRLLGAYLATLVVTVAVAAVFYRFIEDPARKALRARLSQSAHGAPAT